MSILIALCLFVWLAGSSTLAANWQTDFGELLQRRVRMDSQNVDSFLGDVMACKTEVTEAAGTTAGTKNWTRCDSSNKLCLDLERQCVSVESLLRIYNHSQLDMKNASTIEEISPYLLYQLVTKLCQSAMQEAKRATTAVETWGYGIISVTVITLSKLAGAAFIPIMKKKIFKNILMFFVSLAVGSLAGSGMVHLIPQAFEVTVDDHHTYISRACVAMAGVYLFFVFERLLEMYLGKLNTQAGHGHSHGPPASKESESDEMARLSTSDAQKKPEGLATVAWMILISDGLHNFIDGLSIGAAFTDRTMFGISVSLAILFEELPHGLGDLAIMLNAGVPIRRALLYNYLSSIPCYIGLCVGIGASSNTGFSVWIYAVAGGMFLFISLVIMVPEMNSALEELADEQSESSGRPKGHARTSTKLKLFFVQNVGIWIGFGLMVVTGRYGADIKID